MHQNASFDIEFVVFTIPVSLKSYWYSVPSVGVNVS